MEHSQHFKWPQKILNPAHGQKCHFRNFQFGTFDPVMEFEIFYGKISFEVLECTIIKLYP